MNTFRSLPSWLNTLTVIFLLLAFTLSPVNAHAAPVQETSSVSRNVDVTLPIPPLSTGTNDQQEPITPPQTSDTTELAEAAASEDIPPDWLSRVQESIRQSEYHVTWQDQIHMSGLPGAYQAPNRAHDLRTYFTPDGIRIVRRTEVEPSWEWGLTLTGYGYAADIQPVAAAELVAADNRIEYHRSNPTASPGENQAIVEWYVNDEQGLEQGFTLASAPESRIPNPGSQIALDLTLSGNLTAHPSADGNAIEFTTPGGVRVLHYGKLYAYDATGRELPVQLVPLSAGKAASDSIDAIRLVVDSADAVYPITVDPLATSPGWTADGNQDNALFGCSVNTAGDVNGDGYADVIVGARLYDHGQTNEGRAYVYTGTVAGLSTTADWTVESNMDSAYFGVSVSTAGDVNGDGYSDVIIGAHGYVSDGEKIGRVFVYTGTVTGLSTTADWTAESDQHNSLFGVRVGTAGDVNGDGYSDVIVGANMYDTGQTQDGNEGRVYVYTGTVNGLSTTADWTADVAQASANFGAWVDTAGDVNGDGYSDVIIGASYYDNGQTDEGRAYVYHGSSTGLSSTANWEAENNQANSNFGIRVNTAGDVNGDGYSDVIVGAVSRSGAEATSWVYVYHGATTGLVTEASWTVESDQDNSHFGAVGAAGDVNGDGYSDVIVGARLYDSNDQTNNGKIFVYHGSTTGLNTTADWTVEGDQENSYFGFSVGTAGDVDGDGYSDVIASAYAYDNNYTNEGRAYVYHGGAMGLSTTAGWSAESNNSPSKFGFSASTAGDVNGDGYNDVIVGAYAHDNGIYGDAGKVFVYHGSTTGLSTTADWNISVDFATAQFGYSVGTAGDVNGDGFSDVIVGAPKYDSSSAQDQEGWVFVYHGSSSGLTTGSADWTAEGNENYAHFGYSVGTAGDVNGDGFSDVIVGTPAYDNPSYYMGQARVYLGTSSGLNTTPNWSIQGSGGGVWFGHSVGTAGDVNGDGYSDVIVGAPYDDDGGLDHIGKAFLYLGSSNPPNYLSTTADWTGKGTQEREHFGYSVGTAGDVNGDGYSDVIVGAYYYDTASDTNAGKAFVYHGTDDSPYLSTTADWSVEGSQANAQFGYSVGTAGDVNGDGFSDVIVGANEYTNGQTDEGKAYVYHGASGGVSTSASWTVEGNQSEEKFGTSVGTAGDVNGDGYSDIIVGGIYANGRADLYYGNGGDGLHILPRQLRSNGSATIAPLGKSNLTSTVQIRLIGRMPLGRADVKLEWQIAPLGTEFTATSGVISGTSAAWTDTGTAGAVITQNVTSLTADTAYHWRARLLYRPGNRLGQSASRWVHIPWNGWLETDFRTDD